MVPGCAGGDSCGEEGEKVVDGVRGERQRDRRHQTAFTVVPEINIALLVKVSSGVKKGTKMSKVDLCFSSNKLTK